MAEKILYNEEKIDEPLPVPEGKMVSPDIATGNISSSFILSPLIKTALTGPRAVIEENDMYLFDDSTGGTIPITGNTATLFFPRVDDETQRFIMRKRAGINFDAENIMELFWEKAANPDISAQETDYKSPASNTALTTPYDSPWTNPTYAYGSNNYYTTSSQGDIHYHCWYNFSMFIPPAAIILGITVKVEAKMSGPDLGTARLQIGLTKNKNEYVGEIKYTDVLTNSDVFYTLGGPTDLWSSTWTPSELKTNFGVTMVAGTIGTSPTPDVYSIDSIQIKVRYYLPADFPRENYIFIGRAGDQVATASRTEVVSITANEIFQLEHPSASGALWFVVSSDYSGAAPVEMWGQGLAGGTRNYFSFKDMGTALVFSDSPSFQLWDTITGNVTGATAYIGTKTDANNYTGVFITGTFDPATDNACTTNGAGGGSGTGNLSSVTSTEFNPVTGEGGGVMLFGHQATLAGTDWISAQLWIDAYNIWFEDDIIPYSDNANDIGSPTHQVKDIYVGGSIIGAVDFTGLTTRKYSLSDNLRNSNDGVKIVDSSTYAKVKEVLLNENLPVCRIRFTMLRDYTFGSFYCRIYKNGVAIGTERVIGALTTFSENFTNFVSGDKIQIYGKVDDGYSTVYNMRFYYDYNLTKIGPETLTTPLEVTEIPISVTNQDP